MYKKFINLNHLKNKSFKNISLFFFKKGGIIIQV